MTVFAAFALALLQPAAEPVTVIHAGTLLAEPGKPARRNASVIVRGRTIEDVRDGFIDMPGARVVDLRNATVLPGLIDSHVHLSGLDDRLQARLQAAGRDNEDEAFTAILNARKTLLAGFTTVRDLGGDPRLVLSLRDFDQCRPILRTEHPVGCPDGVGVGRAWRRAKRCQSQPRQPGDAARQHLQRRRRLPPRDP